MLTEEQNDLVKMVIAGLTNEQIAEVIGFSVATVKKRLGVIYKILNVKNRISLILFFMQNNELSDKCI